MKKDWSHYRHKDEEINLHLLRSTEFKTSEVQMSDASYESQPYRMPKFVTVFNTFPQNPIQDPVSTEKHLKTT